MQTDVLKEAKLVADHKWWSPAVYRQFAKRVPVILTTNRSECDRLRAWFQFVVFEANLIKTHAHTQETKTNNVYAKTQACSYTLPITYEQQ